MNIWHGRTTSLCMGTDVHIIDVNNLGPDAPVGQCSNCGEMGYIVNNAEADALFEDPHHFDPNER